MDMKIKSIILWPKNKGKEIRKIDFELDKINVITGKSQTGKSALIPIIDYCLGSGKCTIPVGIIRDNTEWFGVLFQLGSNQMLLARKEPGGQEQTGKMYIKEGQNLDIPKFIDKDNINAELVKSKLNQLANLTNLDFISTIENYSNSAFKSRPSFRDMAAFEFQPQHIIANPYTLFFKADTYEHQEKLKTIFPLVLGIIDSTTISLKHELKELETELRKKQKEKENREVMLESWKMELKASYTMAKELGFLYNSPNPKDNWQFYDYKEYLEKVLLEVSDSKLPKLDIGATDRVVKELTSLKAEERYISQLLESNRLKLSKLNNLRSSTGIYKDDLEFQTERLRGIGWFEEKIKENNCCPVCLSKQDSAFKEIKKLEKVAKEVKYISINVNESGNILDKEIKEIRNLTNDLERRLNIIREHRILLESKSGEVKIERQTVEEVYRFIGRLEQSIDNWDKVRVDGKLNIEILKLELKINELRQKINPELERQRLKAYMTKISLYMAKYAKEIGVERPNDVPELDIKNLSLTITSDDGRKDYLWEIGSGANWMGYHISALLAIHEHLISIKYSHVPRFLVIDQPSQVYFPETWPEDQLDNISQKDKERRDDDISRVGKIFKTLSQFLNNTEKKVQIIVVEHADETTWSGIENVHVVARWRDDEALIPKDWIDN